MESSFPVEVGTFKFRDLQYTLSLPMIILSPLLEKASSASFTVSSLAQRFPGNYFMDGD